LRAASINAGVTALGGGAAAFSGSANSTPAASAVEVLSRSRRVHLLCCKASLPRLARAAAWAGASIFQGV
jgi:hypothetical protein